MMSRRKSRPNPARRIWEPMALLPTFAYTEGWKRVCHRELSDEGVRYVETWHSPRYLALRKVYDDGSEYLSIRREDRKVIREWRDLQWIKNDICGPDRWAVEIFPPEDQLIDSANQYHLWVYAPGTEPPFGFKQERITATRGDAQVFNETYRGNGRQRFVAWQKDGHL